MFVHQLPHALLGVGVSPIRRAPAITLPLRSLFTFEPAW
jgi:hypothetical protein